MSGLCFSFIRCQAREAARELSSIIFYIRRMPRGDIRHNAFATTISLEIGPISLGAMELKASPLTQI